MKTPFRCLLIIVCYLTIIKYGYSQKNSLSITPLNAIVFGSTELSYERRFKNHFAVNVDFQIWFFDREPINFNLLGNPDPPTFERNICKGSRYSLGLHRYLFTKGNKIGKMYIGVGAFYGHHKVERYDNDLYGEVETGNYGVKLSQGVQLKLRNGIFFDFGFDFGRSWLTRERTTYALYNSSGEARSRRRLPMPVWGIFIDPRIAIGYKF